MIDLGSYRSQNRSKFSEYTIIVPSNNSSINPDSLSQIGSILTRKIQNYLCYFIWIKKMVENATYMICNIYDMLMGKFRIVDFDKLRLMISKDHYKLLWNTQ